MLYLDKIESLFITWFYQTKLRFATIHKDKSRKCYFFKLKIIPPQKQCDIIFTVIISVLEFYKTVKHLMTALKYQHCFYSLKRIFTSMQLVFVKLSISQCPDACKHLSIISNLTPFNRKRNG